MVHADSSNFEADSTKLEVYNQVYTSCKALFEDQRNWVANLANASSLLWHGLHSLPAPSNGTNWAGFYVLDRKDKGQLILGPFHGKVACQTIRLGKGVCGQSALSGRTSVVRNVHEHEDHIACDSQTKSEIVVPITDKTGLVVGVIDIDCELLDGFDKDDQYHLERLAKLLGSSCDWDV